MADQTITDYVASGVVASRPTTPSPPSGGSSLYYATDESTLYVWDVVAGAWDTVSGGGSGGGVDIISTISPANTVSSYDVDVTGYDEVEFILDGVTFGSSEALTMDMSADAFSTTIDEYQRRFHRQDVHTGTAGSQDTQTSIGIGSGNTTFNLSVHFKRLSLAAPTIVEFMSHNASGASTFHMTYCTDGAHATDIVDTIRIASGGNNFTGGTIYVVGRQA